ncbi:MAG: thiol:disulfide interchange protein DsbC [Deferribacteres bacterium]|nr:thiol:disulfide interchange protein DsbC [Deferribacteres bacterium]
MIKIFKHETINQTIQALATLAGILFLGMFLNLATVTLGHSAEKEYSKTAKEVKNIIKKRLNNKGKVTIINEIDPKLLTDFKYIKLNITTDADNKTFGFYTDGKYVITGLTDLETGENVINYIKAISDIVNVEIRSDELMYGNVNAPVKIVVFSDFECPYCKTASKEMKEIIEKHRNKVAIFYKHYPLPFHKHAELLAKIYEAGKKMGYKWDMYESDYSKKNNEEIIKLFEKKLPDNKLVEFYKYMNSQEVEDKINKNKDEGNTLGIKGTPYILINGHPIEGYQPVLIDKILKSELN